MTALTSHAPAIQPGQTKPAPRQFVNFSFYKLDPAFRRLSADHKTLARDEFLAALSRPPGNMMCLTYSAVGLRSDVDFLLWRISHEIDDFQAHTQVINCTSLGAYLTTPHSYLSMTKRSVYVEKLDPFHSAENRSRIVPGRRKFLFVYPFVKSRDWYLLSMERRQEIMDVHIRVGNEFPSVKLNTTYSFGLDDQEFVVAFESDVPQDFLDLVMKLRETESSRFTVRDTPIFTCIQLPMDRIMEQLF